MTTALVKEVLNGESVCSNTSCNSVSLPSVSHPNHLNANFEMLESCATLNELTLPTFTHSSKQIVILFLRKLYQYFEVNAIPKNLKLPLA
jgi:hypothetical protein